MSNKLGGIYLRVIEVVEINLKSNKLFALNDQKV
jgi:hypothetical protein